MARSARSDGADQQNQASQQQRTARAVRVGWSAISPGSLEAGGRVMASSATGTGGSDELDERSSRCSSCLCCRSGTAGFSGESAQRQFRSVVLAVQHDCPTASLAPEQQHPQQHCLARHVSCFVAQKPADGTTAVQAIAVISKRETKMVDANGNMSRPLLSFG
jgi:hypothetical protein